MIPNWRYTHEYQKDKERILELVDRVFSSGRLILGEEVRSFEEHFAGYCGVAHGVGVNSGTDALFLALKALGVKQGNEVITVSNTAVPTVAAICAAGATPVFVDVEEDTFLMDVRKVEPLITPNTRGIIPVHLFGQPVDMDPLLLLAKQRALFILEDCAQAAGALYKGKKVGSLGDFGAFSFYPTKVLGAFGDGGMVVTNSAEHDAKLRRLRFYGMDKAYYSEEEGYNSRLDEVQAALLDDKLQRLDKSVRSRQEIAEAYSSGLAGTGDLVLPKTAQDRTHQFYVYSIKTNQRDALIAYLMEHGVETRINYPVPVHLMRGYAHLNYKTGAFPVTERLAGQILSLPLYPGMARDDIDTVIRSVRSFFARVKGKG